MATRAPVEVLYARTRRTGEMNSLVSIGRSRLCGTNAPLKSRTIRFCCGCDAVYWIVSFVVMMTRLTLSRFLKSRVASDGPCGAGSVPERISGVAAPLLEPKRP
jgi:hypothetical protein